jgi:hypothetical protein
LAGVDAHDFCQFLRSVTKLLLVEVEEFI